MALGLKILVAVTTIGGLSIGVPVYLLQQGKNIVEAKIEPSISPSPVTITPASKPLDKNSCKTSILPHTWESFLQKHQKSLASYSFVSCNNITVEGESTSLLKNDWQALFPKNTLEEIFLPQAGEKFEMNVEEKTVDRDTESAFLIIFKNSKKGLSIQSRFKAVDENFGKKVVTVLIEENGYVPKEIYLLLPLDAKEEDPAP